MSLNSRREQSPKKSDPNEDDETLTQTQEDVVEDEEPGTDTETPDEEEDGPEPEEGQPGTTNPATVK